MRAHMAYTASAVVATAVGVVLAAYEYPHAAGLALSVALLCTIAAFDAMAQDAEGKDGPE
ncbi:MAG: hypothetical protein IT285_16085 [Bdellovibrionales bacterium]|nr:hypothetical protein [Bdellovibrionales bacterium]